MWFQLDFKIDINAPGWHLFSKPAHVHVSCEKYTQWSHGYTCTYTLQPHFCNLSLTCVAADFWAALGGKTEYQTSERLESQTMTHPLRLFGCSNKTGRFIVSIWSTLLKHRWFIFMLLLYCIVLEANYRCGGSFVLLLYFVHAKEPAHLITILKNLTCESALQSLLPHLNYASLKLLFCFIWLPALNPT